MATKKRITLKRISDHVAKKKPSNKKQTGRKQVAKQILLKRPASRLEPEPRRIFIKSLTSVPANPDVSAFLETALLEPADSTHVLELGQGVRVTRETVLEEHGTFSCYRERLLMQLLKRRWFAALTEITSRRFFTSKPPRFLAAYIHSTKEVIEGELRGCPEIFGTDRVDSPTGGQVDRHWTLGKLMDAGLVRFILKGGNGLTLVKLQALWLLPGDVASLLGEMRPRELSDVDFSLLIGGHGSPEWLTQRDPFQHLHERCCSLVEAALLRWVRGLDTLLAAKIGRGRDNSSGFANIVEFFEEADGPGRHAMGIEIARRLNSATAQLRREMRKAIETQKLRVPGFCSDSFDPIVQQLDRTLRVAEHAWPRARADAGSGGTKLGRSSTDSAHPFTNGALRARSKPSSRSRGSSMDGSGNTSLSVTPVRRPESMRILANAGCDGHTVVEYRGSARRFFVSFNPEITFRDAACVKEDDHCSFALIRVLLPFQLSLPEVQVNQIREDEDGTQLGLSRSEAIDVSIPRFGDRQRKEALELDARSSGFARKANFYCEGQKMCSIFVESLEALLLEQRNLTFGSRMQALLIWRVAKVSKRLGRLVELLGITAMCTSASATGEVLSWASKAEAFEQLAHHLTEFVREEVMPNFVEDPSPASPALKRRRVIAKAMTVGCLIKPPALANDELPHGVHAVWEAAKIKQMLLEPLQQLSLKTFSEDLQKKMPAEFVAKWNDILVPLATKARLFATAFRELARCGAEPLDEESLYNFELSSDWGL